MSRTLFAYILLDVLPQCLYFLSFWPWQTQIRSCYFWENPSCKFSNKISNPGPLFVDQHRTYIRPLLSFSTAGAGIICAISLIPIRLFKYEIKPVLYYFGKDIVPLGPIEIPDKQPQPRIRFYWQHSSLFRLHVRIITAIDIILLELEFGLKLFYILTFDIDTVVIASSTTLAATGIFVSVITIAYGAKVLKRLKRLEYSMLQVYAAASQ